MVKYFLMFEEVVYYVVIPILAILVAYLIFSLIYKKKKGTYYYNYVVDYVYSSLGIIFCSLLFSMLLGYTIATLQILYVSGVLTQNILPVIMLIVLPIIPACFLIYVLRIYVKNLRRKLILDDALIGRDTELIKKQK